MMESDLQTLMKVSEVSKYWHYLSKINLVRDTVYKKEGSFRVDQEEFEQYQKGSRSDPRPLILPHKEVRWLQYDRETYPQEWLVQDQHLALSLNKKIVDADKQSLLTFGTTLGINHNGPRAHVTQIEYDRVMRYLVKMRLKPVARTMNYGHWMFDDENGNKYYIQNSLLKPEWQFIKGTQVEIIGDLWDVEPNVMWFRTVHRFRLLDTRRYIAGMIPIHDYLGILAFLLLAPCAMLDLWTLPSSVQYLFNYGFSVTALVTTFIFVGHIFWTSKLPERVKECIYYIAGVSVVLLCGIIFTPWNITLKIALFVGAAHMITIYFINVFKYVTRSYHKYAVAIFGYSGTTLLFMVDWKTMSESFKDGTIRTTFLYNSLILLGFLLFLLSLTLGRNLLRRTPAWTWRSMIKMDKPLYQYMITFVPATIGLTLSAPHMYRSEA